MSRVVQQETCHIYNVQDISGHASALALKEILCLFEISVVMQYCFIWLICKNNSPEKPFLFKFFFLSPTTMLYVYSEKEH